MLRLVRLPPRFHTASTNSGPMSEGQLSPNCGHRERSYNSGVLSRSVCFSISAMLIAGCAVSETPLRGATLAMAEQLRRPPPPPANVDPQSGPFIVHLSGHGRIERGQIGVIANAVRQWSGERLQAFSICFQSERPAVDWGAASRALEEVAAELKARGAVVVVQPSGLRCDPTSPRSTQRQGSYVTIIGVVRA